MIERVTDPDVGELINGEPWTEMDRIVWRAMHHVTQNRFERAQDIAAAVAAHMESPEVIERAGRGMREATTGDDMWAAMLPHMRDLWCKHASAAIRAAVRGGE